MERINSEAKDLGEITSELKLKQQIFDKVRRRMSELEHEGHLDSSFCSELNPDVIVISDDNSLLLEPQNLQVTEWLKRHLRMESLVIRERIRVHPAESRRMATDLKAAGFEVAC